MMRCLYAIPSSSVFHNEVVLKLEKDAADNKISATEFRTKLHVSLFFLRNDFS